MLLWLRRVAAGGASQIRTYHLVYSESSVGIIKTVSKLIRLAHESTDSSNFADLMVHENITGTSEIWDALGADYYSLLKTCELEHVPESILERHILSRAEQIVGTSRSKQLYQALFHRLSKAQTGRLTLSIISLIKEAEAQGVYIHQSLFDSSDAKPEENGMMAALLALRSCPEGVPVVVLAKVAERNVNELEQESEPLIQSGDVSVSEGFWFLKSDTSIREVADNPTVTRTALNALLDYIDDHGRGPHVRALMDSVVRLCQMLVSRSDYLDSVASVFCRIQNHLKRMGDKRLILKVANLSIQAAQACRTRTVETRKAETQTLICGRSWVLQRVGDLAEARVAAEKSLKCGEDLGWPRNTAFCRKCVGRLYRMEAEAETDQRRRRELLFQSVASLEEAICRFRDLDEDDSEAEVGACYSLLVRSYLVSEQMHRTADAIRLAQEGLIDRANKDFYDLEILKGDYAAAERNWSDALKYYDLALSLSHAGDAEKTEMRGRAYMRRGETNVKKGDVTAAIHDYRAAASIYAGLNEPDAEAEAKWKVLSLTEEFPPQAEHILEKEEARVRVGMAEIYLEQCRNLNSKGRRPHREEPASAYWTDLNKKVKKRIVVDDKDWT